MKARFLLCVLALLSLAACKQGRGDVCQIDDDCEAPLTCNAGTQRCQAAGSDSVDAAQPADAALPPDAAIVIDAAPIDAAPK